MIRYNGYTFTDRANVTLDAETIYGPDNRTPISQRIVVVVKDIVAPRTSDPLVKINTAEMNTVREALKQPGQMFELSGHGFGDAIIVNPSGSGRRDIASGPKPRVLRWEPIGFDGCAGITWTVEVTLSPCSERFVGITSLTYGVAFSINERGYTTRTIEGTLKAAQSVQNGQATASADSYREKIVIDSLVNCHRTQDYRLSADKSSLAFSITDTEIESPNSYPFGVVNISAPLRTRFKWPDRKATQTTSSLSVQVELEATQPRVLALQIFSAILNHRFGLYDAEGVTYFFRDLEIAEDLFTHKYSFAAVITTVDKSLNEQLRLLRYFSPLAQNWDNWHDSQALINRQRGLSNLKHARNTEIDNDPLVSLCDDPDAVELRVSSLPEIKFPAAVVTDVLCQPRPPAGKSWTEFDSHLIEATGYQRVFNATMGDTSISQIQFNESEAGAVARPLSQVDTAGYESYLSEAPPEQRWIWKGTAERVGWPIPPPGKLTINGEEAKIIGTPRFQSRLVGYAFCQPVYRATWNIGLIVMNTPEAITEEDTDPAQQYPPEPDSEP